MTSGLKPYSKYDLPYKYSQFILYSEHIFNFFDYRNRKIRPGKLIIKGVADRAVSLSFSTRFLGKLHMVVLKKIAQLEKQVFKIISALIVI